MNFIIAATLTAAMATAACNPMYAAEGQVTTTPDNPFKQKDNDSSNDPQGRGAAMLFRQINNWFVVAYPEEGTCEASTVWGSHKHERTMGVQFAKRYGTMSLFFASYDWPLPLEKISTTPIDVVITIDGVNWDGKGLAYQAPSYDGTSVGAGLSVSIDADLLLAFVDGNHIKLSYEGSEISSHDLSFSKKAINGVRECVASLPNYRQT
jgi:hypothetical protein